MDVSATKRWKALDPAGAMAALRKGISIHPGLPVPGDRPVGRRESPPAGRALPGPRPTRATLSNALLIAAFSLSLAGCGVLQPDTTARTTAPPQAGTKGAHELASAPKPPEALASPAPLAPQQPRRTIETKSPPATADKGAAKLVAPSAPAPVRASEKTLVKAEAVEPKGPITADSGTVTATPVKELVFRGPPPKARAPWAGMKVLVWLGLGLAGAALAILARLHAGRPAKPREVLTAKEDDLIAAPGLLLKESVNMPKETIVAERTGDPQKGHFLRIRVPTGVSPPGPQPQAASR